MAICIALVALVLMIILNQVTRPKCINSNDPKEHMWMLSMRDHEEVGRCAVCKRYEDDDIEWSDNPKEV